MEIDEDYSENDKSLSDYDSDDYDDPSYDVLEDALSEFSELLVKKKGKLPSVDVFEAQLHYHLRHLSANA